MTLSSAGRFVWTSAPARVYACRFMVTEGGSGGWSCSKLPLALWRVEQLCAENPKTSRSDPLCGARSDAVAMRAKPRLRFLLGTKIVCKIGHYFNECLALAESWSALSESVPQCPLGRRTCEPLALLRTSLIIRPKTANGNTRRFRWEHKRSPVDTYLVYKLTMFSLFSGLHAVQ